MVNINGTEYEPRSLTLPEVRKLRGMSEDDSDVTAIAWACGVRVDEVRAWFEKVPAGVAMAAVSDVLEASKLTEGARFPGPAGNDAGNAPGNER